MMVLRCPSPFNFASSALTRIFSGRQLFSHDVSAVSARRSYSQIEVDKLTKGTDNKPVIITTIGINRPEKRNCVNLETAKELEKALSTFELDASSQVAVLHGKGGHFSSGLDLFEVAKIDKDFDFARSGNYNPSNAEGIGPMGPTRKVFKKPIIAAVTGYAVAGGLELALMCDMRVMEESAKFGVFCRRFGVPLIDGGTVRLPALIGLSRALDLILTGRPVGSKEAYKIGLANKIVPDGTSLSESIKLAESIGSFPQKCMNLDRTSAYRSAHREENFEKTIEAEMRRGLRVIKEESVTGAKSFTDGVGRHGSFS